jgi:hypothetical protein
MDFLGFLVSGWILGLFSAIGIWLLLTAIDDFRSWLKRVNKALDKLEAAQA